jgi:nucleotide-binding universal stress UspA family protein
MFDVTGLLSMALIVPFDGSALSKTALARAVQFQTVLKEEVLVVSVIPKNNVAYARERGWIDSTEPFNAETVISSLRKEVSKLAPDVEFHYIFVDRYATKGTISGRIKKFIRKNNGTIVFLGSENAGKIISAFTVGQSIGSGRTYDTYIITSEDPPEIEELDEEQPLNELLA